MIKQCSSSFKTYLDRL